jgi:hypothetical protein
MELSSTHLKGLGCSQFGVSDDDEFSHDCGDGDERFFARAKETFVEGAEGGVVFCGGDCGHEEDSFHFGSSAAGSAIGVGLAALIGMGRKACQGGGLASGERTEFGHEGDKGGGGFLTDAGYGDQGLDGLGDRLAGGAQSLDVGFDRLDLRVEAFEERLEINVDGLGGGGGATIGVGEAILDEVASGQDERLQALSLGLAGAPKRKFGVAVQPVSGKRGCVDGVGFTERPKRADEGLDPRVKPEGRLLRASARQAGTPAAMRAANRSRS